MAKTVGFGSPAPKIDSSGKVSSPVRFQKSAIWMACFSSVVASGSAKPMKPKFEMTSPTVTP